MSIQPTCTGTSTQEGFSVVELMVALTVSVGVLALVLLAFDTSTRIATSQESVAEVQQGVRISARDVTRLLRMTGRGGLPRPIAIAVTQNVPLDTVIAGERVLQGPDVLIIRGSFSSPVYRINVADSGAFTRDDDTATVVIDELTGSNFAQDLGSLAHLVDADDNVMPEALLLIGRQGDAIFGVAELAGLGMEEVDLDIQNAQQTISRATLTLNLSAAASVRAGEYSQLSQGGAFPATLTSALFLSVLEEYRFFVREDTIAPGGGTGRESPKLTRARVYPGTNVLHPAGNGTTIDISDNLSDFQVAFGIDLDGDGLVNVEDADGVPLDTDSDEWMFNDGDDDLTLAWATSPLQYVRVSFLARTNAPDTAFVSPPIAAIEDRVYGELVDPSGTELEQRRYRRRMLQTLVDLRNL